MAYRWKLGSHHPVDDICDMYAHADLYGLGAGIFPEDQAPVNPAHPHCLCHYAPVYASELKGKKRSDNVEGRGNAWLKRQPLRIRQAILGVKGEQEWKAGRVGWMEKARNISPPFTKKESRFVQAGAIAGGVYEDYIKEEEKARLIYKEIIHAGKEAFTNSISANTQFSRRFVGQVYDYVFIEKHQLDEGLQNFSPDIDMAHSFKRLMSGEFKHADIILLRHEHLERALEKRYNLTIRQAHEITDKKYGYQELIERGQEND